MTTVAGFLLRQNLYLRFPGYEDVLNGHLQQDSQGIEVVRAGQGLPFLPFIDGLRSLKTKVLLQVRNGQTAGFAEVGNVPAGGNHVNHGKVLDGHENASLSGWSVVWFLGQEHTYIRYEM